MSGPLRLHYSAISDVGRVRKDNQDSGYAGPWLLTVCDGVGGAARGDIASGTAVQQLRRLDEDPPGELTPDDLLGRVAGALHRAHDRIGEIVDDDPALNGTSTTATVLYFDGQRVGVGHIGDSRAYLYRAGEISQLTHDHTFVQSLIDEGRISEAESRVHPHRNLILKALDGVHEAEPDLFLADLQTGDRLLVCSDGASGVLDDARLADVLSTGTPDYAAVERAGQPRGRLVRQRHLRGRRRARRGGRRRPRRRPRRPAADAGRRGRRAAPPRPQGPPAHGHLPRAPLRRHR